MSNIPKLCRGMACCIIILACHTYLDAGENIYRGIMHVETLYSEGAYPLRQIIEHAAEKGISIVIPCDSFLNQWEYGIFPFRSFLKKTAHLPSLSPHHIASYLRDIRECRTVFPDMVILPGIEVSPFYYWEGSILKKNLLLQQANKDLLIIGFEDEACYEKLPLLSNKRAGPYPFDQYHAGRFGEKPYQLLIDYVIEKNGLVFWAHPDADEFIKPRFINSAAVQSLPYGESLMKTRKYTGFAVFKQGNKKSGRVGGYWDAALGMYCAGMLDQPMWAIGEMDYVGPADAVPIDHSQTVFFLDSLSVENVISALKKGAYYALLKTAKHTLQLQEYCIEDGDKRIKSGETLEGYQEPYLNLAITTDDLQKNTVVVYIIINGKEKKSRSAVTPCSIRMPISAWCTEPMNFLRVDIIENESSRIITNPIFIKK